MSPTHTSAPTSSTPTAPEPQPGTEAASDAHRLTPDTHLPYHRMALLHPRHRWWRPLVTLVVFLLCFILMLAALFAAVEGLRLIPSLSEPLGVALSSMDMSHPWAFALTLASVVILLPAALVTQRLCTPPQARRLSSVTGRLRWRLLRRSLGLAALVLTPSLLLMTLTGRNGFEIDGRSMMMLLIVLLLVPFQAAAEEYVFRGLPMQVLGAWLRSPAFAILAPVPLFIAGHGYGVFASISVAAFAVTAGWLTWRTGGLEAAIGLHVVNNVAIMTLGAFGLADLNATEIHPLMLALELATLGAFSWLVLHPGFLSSGRPSRSLARPTALRSAPSHAGGR